MIPEPGPFPAPRRRPPGRARRRQRFPGAPFGPLALRRLVRERFEAGECLVGWTPVRLEPSVFTQALVALVSVMPVAGVVIAGEIARSRLLVLSDRRLWILDPRARHPLAPRTVAEAEHRLDALEFELSGAARSDAAPEHFADRPFRLIIRPRTGGPVSLRFTAGAGEASGRLPEAFRLLAGSRPDPSGYAGEGERSSTDRRKAAP